MTPRCVDDIPRRPVPRETQASLAPAARRFESGTTRDRRVAPSSRPLTPGEQLDVMRSQERRQETAWAFPSERDLEASAAITEELVSLSLFLFTRTMSPM